MILALMLIADVLSGLDAIYPDLDSLYRDLHQHPELSQREEKTAAKMAERLRKLGFEVITGVGGTGVVGVLRNGQGPTVLLRTDMDALPVEDKTGLPYASTVPGVTHACGHDLHMASWVGAATLLSQAKDRWRGTLVFVGQPAEEKVTGARAMLADGLFKRAPKPDFLLTIHDKADLPSGKVGIISGYALANVDTLEMTIFGKGGHGAFPHTTIDPVVLAARTVLALQTVVSRENNPLDPAVITVGSIHGGTKSNIIPDEVKLQLSVRTYKPEVRKRVLDAISRIARGEAISAGAPREPVISVVEGSNATFNDPKLVERVSRALAAAVPIEEVAPVMGAEDFGEFGIAAGAPSMLIWVGAVDPAKFASGAPLPSLHSSTFAPDRERTLRTGVTALTVSAMELLAKP
jgi:hippurate hydrolase